MKMKLLMNIELLLLLLTYYEFSSTFFKFYKQLFLIITFHLHESNCIYLLHFLLYSKYYKLDYIG